MIRIEEIPHLDDPEGAWLAMRREPCAVWLDSLGGQYPELGRYSILASRPLSTIEAHGDAITLRTESGARRFRHCPFAALEAWISDRSTVTDGPLPFQGGAIGFLGYELGRFVERLPEPRPGGLGLPDLWFGDYGEVFLIDHREERSFRARRDDVPPFDVRRLTRAAPPLAPLAASELLGESLDRDAYRQRVEKALEYIAAGDIFQVNLSRRLLLRRPGGDPALPYRHLRRHNGGPFSACLDLGGGRMLWSTSPERFLAREDRRVETRPIKGTIARSPDPETDLRNREQLRASAKDAAELTMIVDLERNDLGRVCEYGSVRVEEAKRLETYPTVHHLVARVTGELRSDVGLSDLLRATFPGGSITGAPKIRAMEIIHQLEPVPREAYTGAVGWISGDRLDLNIAIRTAFAAGDRCAVHLGSGIVADSDPELEWRETEAKGRGLLRALSGAGQDRELTADGYVGLES
ncbi:MAG: anthranilate synthase component I family protein [Planctomycetota bacterium]